MQYALTQHPTPVFNTPHIAVCFGGENGDTLALDSQGLMRTVETVLFPHSKLLLLEQMGSSIWKIKSDEYRYGGDCYIDGRFVQFSTSLPANRTPCVPSISIIKSTLDQLVGTRYLWGGNWPQGIDLMTQFYPSRTPLSQLPSLVQDTWLFKGVDCSGLFHYVSNGYTARNSSKLVHFGIPVPMKETNIHEIMDKIEA